MTNTNLSSPRTPIKILVTGGDGGISPNQAEENYWNNYKPVASFT